jgi:hypothetical protein
VAAGECRPQSEPAPPDAAFSASNSAGPPYNSGRHALTHHIICFAPSPLATFASAMEALPDEILQEIILLVIEDAGDATACSLAAVSHHVRAVSWPIRWRSLKITMPNAAFVFALHLERNPDLSLPVQNLLLWSYGPVHRSLWSRPAPSAFSRLLRTRHAQPARFQDGRAAMEWAATRILSALAPTLRFVGFVVEGVPNYDLLPVNLPLAEEIALGISLSRTLTRACPERLRAEAYPTLRRLHIAVDKSIGLSDAVTATLRKLKSLAPSLTHLRMSSCTPDDMQLVLARCAKPASLRRVTFQPSPDAWSCYTFGFPIQSSECINALPENIRGHLHATGGPLHLKVALMDWVGGPLSLKTRYARQYLGQISCVVTEDFDGRRTGGDMSWDEGQLVQSAEFKELLAHNAGATFDFAALYA